MIIILYIQYVPSCFRIQIIVIIRNIPNSWNIYIVLTYFTTVLRRVSMLPINNMRYMFLHTTYIYEYRLSFIKRLNFFHFVDSFRSYDHPESKGSDSLFGTSSTSSTSFYNFPITFAIIVLSWYLRCPVRMLTTWRYTNLALQFKTFL